MTVGAAGVVLAAGAGRRFGRPKATVVDPDGTSWLRRAVDTLRSGGCEPVVTVLGAGADQAAGHLAELEDVAVVVAVDWADGLSASLRSGLAAIAERADADVEVLAITLVDLPDVGVEVLDRLLSTPGLGRDSLLRASYSGRPGHPVVIGRDHWAALGRSVSGDRGAASYLDAHGAVSIECGDLAGGRDTDRSG